MLQKRMQSESFQVKFPILRLNDQAPSIVSRLCDRNNRYDVKGKWFLRFLSANLLIVIYVSFFLHWIYYKMVD